MSQGNTYFFNEGVTVYQETNIPRNQTNSFIHRKKSVMNIGVGQIQLWKIFLLGSSARGCLSRIRSVFLIHSADELFRLPFLSLQYTPKSSPPDTQHRIQSQPN